MGFFRKGFLISVLFSILLGANFTSTQAFSGTKFDGELTSEFVDFYNQTSRELYDTYSSLIPYTKAQIGFVKDKVDVVAIFSKDFAKESFNLSSNFARDLSQIFDNELNLDFGIAVDILDSSLYSFRDEVFSNFKFIGSIFDSGVGNVANISSSVADESVGFVLNSFDFVSDSSKNIFNKTTSKVNSFTNKSVSGFEYSVEQTENQTANVIDSTKDFSISIWNKIYCPVNNFFGGSACGNSFVEEDQDSDNSQNQNVVVENTSQIVDEENFENIQGNQNTETRVIEREVVRVETPVYRGITLSELDERLTLFEEQLDLSAGERIVVKRGGGSSIDVDNIYEDFSETATEAANQAITGGEKSFSGVNGTFTGDVSADGLTLSGALTSATTSTSTFSGPVQATQFIGDGSQLTGINFPAGIWSTSTDGVYYSSGNVGIGTSTPQKELSIADLSGNPEISMFTTNNGVDSNWLLKNGWDTGGGTFSIGDNDGDYFYVDSTGYVGVGTSTPAAEFSVIGDGLFSGNVGIGNTSPSYKLDVSGAINTSSTVNIQGSNRLERWSATNHGDFLRTYDTGDNRAQIALVPNGTPTFTRSRLLLGMTDVVSDETNYEFMTLAARGDDSAYWLSSEAGGTGTLRPIKIRFNSLDAVTFDTDGNVGIGTNSPNENLTIDGNQNFLDGNGDEGLVIKGETDESGYFGSTLTLREQGVADSDTTFGYKNGGFTINTNSGDETIQFQINSQNALSTEIDGSSILLTGGIIGGAFRISPTTNADLDFEVTGTGGGEELKLQTGTGDLFLQKDNNFILNGDGSTSTNAVLFGADSDAGIYYDGSDFVFDSQLVGTGDFVFNNGDLKLGTEGSGQTAYFYGNNSNSNRTHFRIDGTVDDTRLRFYENGGSLVGQWFVGTNNMTFYTESGEGRGVQFGTEGNQDDIVIQTDHDVIFNNGNVGIGTTDPDGLLHIEGDEDAPNDLFRVINNNTGFNSAVTSFLAPNLPNGGNTGFNFGKAASNNNGGTLRYTHVGDGSTSNRISLDFFGNNDLFNVLASGNVGIGTTTPLKKLTIAGSGFDPRVLIDTTDTASYPGLEFRHNGNQALRALIRSDYESGSPNLTFFTSDAGIIEERFRIDGNGNVGIGTDSPSEKLHIEESLSGVLSMMVDNTSTASDNVQTAIRVRGTDGSGGLTGGTFGYVSPNNTSFPSLAGYVDLGSFSAAEGFVIRSADSTKPIRFMNGVNASDEVMRIVDGNVGIGTDSPGEALDVNGNIKWSGSYILTEAVAGAPAFRNVESGEAANFRLQTADRDATDDVQFNFDILGQPGDSNREFGTVGFRQSGGDRFRIGVGITGTGNLYPIHFEMGDANPALVIDTDSSVGIGTDSPNTLLDINGTGSAVIPFLPNSTVQIVDNVAGIGGVSMKNTNTGNSSEFRFTVADDQDEAYLAFTMPSQANTGTLFGRTRGDIASLFVSGADPRALVLGTYNDEDLIFGTDNTERMTIDGSGNVGIGTDSPIQLLHIESTTGNARVLTKTTATGNYTAAQQIISNDSDLFFGAADDAYTDVSEYAGKPFVQGNGGNFALVAQSGDLEFYSGGRASGNKNMVLDSSGNLGIGTDSPDELLHVSDTLSNGSGVFNKVSDTGGQDAFFGVYRYGSGNRYGMISFDEPDGQNYSFLGAAGFGTAFNAQTGDDIFFRIDNQNKMVVDSDGNVGIGTSTPDTALDIYGSSPDSNTGVLNVYGEHADAYQPLISLNKENASGNGWGIGVGDGGQYDGYFYIKRPGGDVTKDFYMTSSGLATFGNSLAVNDGQSIRSSTSGSLAFWKPWDGSSESLFSFRSAGGVNKTAKMNFQAYYYDTSLNAVSSVMALTANNNGGAVGINGDESPEAHLEIVNTSGTDNFMISSSAGNDGDLFIVDSGGDVGIGTSSPQQKLHVYRSTDGAPIRIEDSNGYCEIDPTSTTWTCTSDERLKDNIESLSNASIYEKVTQLNPVSFQWKSDGTNAERTGLIAQEVEEIFPDLVRTNEDGYKSVAYGGFTTYMISAIIEMGQKIETVFNGAADLVVASVSSISLKAEREICIDDVCIDKEDLKKIIENNVASSTDSTNDSERTSNIIYADGSDRDQTNNNEGENTTATSTATTTQETTDDATENTNNSTSTDETIDDSTATTTDSTTDQTTEESQENEQLSTQTSNTEEEETDTEIETSASTATTTQ